MQKTTDELLKQLRYSRSMDDFNKYKDSLSKECGYSSLAEYILTYIRTHEIQESDLIRTSQIQRNYAYQILNGTKNPGRDKVLAICLAAQMSFEDTQRALCLANLGKLYPRRTRDSVIIFALEHQLSVQQTNELLYEEGEMPLE